MSTVEYPAQANQNESSHRELTLLVRADPKSITGELSIELKRIDGEIEICIHGLDGPELELLEA